MMKLDHYLIPYININSKWIKGLSIRPEAIKTLTRKYRRYAFQYCLTNFFLNMSLKGNKSKNKWYYFKLKRFCTAKETINKRKIYRMGEDICNHISNNGLTPIYIKNSYNSTKTKQPNLKMNGRDLLYSLWNSAQYYAAV